MLKWHGEEFKRQLRTEMSKRLDMAGAYLRAEVVKNISLPTRTLGPSLVGEYPHADTGKLRQSIFTQRTSPTTLIVGSSLVYAKVHEYKGRSFFRRTIFERAAQLAKILGAPIRFR